MCGRFFVDAKNREIDRLLAMLPEDAPAVKLGDVYPSDRALVLRRREGEIVAEAMSWGFPRREGKGLIINARGETVNEKPTFKFAARKNPLAIPASGFYEWESVVGQKGKNKYLFKKADEGILYLAGFWRAYEEEDAAKRRFVILTETANADVSFCHERMPVLLGEKEIRGWLWGEYARESLNANFPALLAVKV